MNTPTKHDSLSSIAIEVSQIVKKRRQNSNSQPRESNRRKRTAETALRNLFPASSVSKSSARARRFAEYERKISHLRKEHGYDQRKLAALLDDPRVNEKKSEHQSKTASRLATCVSSTFTAHEVNLYKEIAARNLPLSEIEKRFVAGHYGFRDPRDPDDEFAIAVLRIENRIINQAWKSRLLIPRLRGSRGDDRDRDLDEDHNLENKAIAAGSSETGDLAVIQRQGGRPDTTFSSKRLDSFEISGPITRRGGHGDDGEDGSDAPVSDDYSEESVA